MNILHANESTWWTTPNDTHAELPPTQWAAAQLGAENNWSGRWEYRNVGIIISCELLKCVLFANYLNSNPLLFIYLLIYSFQP